MKSIWLTFTLAFTPAGVAEEDPIWQITPSECVVTRAIEYCDTSVRIELISTEQAFQDACIYVDQQWVGCFEANRRVFKFPLLIEKTVHIYLKTQVQGTVATHTIEHTVIEPTQKRRRVRLPWSVF